MDLATTETEKVGQKHQMRGMEEEAHLMGVLETNTDRLAKFSS